MRSLSLDGPSIVTGAAAGSVCYVAGTAAGIDGPSLRVGCGIAWLVVALVVGRRPDLWVALGRRRLLAVPIVVPTGAAAVYHLRAELVDGTGVSLSVLGWLLGFMLLGVAIWILGNRVYADRAAGERRASWTANPDRGRRRQMRRWSLFVGLGTIAAFVGVLYGLPDMFLSAGIAALIILQIDVRRARQYEAYEHGLRYAAVGTVTTQYVPWERFDGLRETDDAVVLERRWWLDERMAADGVSPDAREALRAAVGSPRGRDGSR